MAIRLQSLRFKVTAGVAVILVLVLGVVFGLQYRWLRRELLERLGLSSTPLSDVIKGSLRHAMQTRNHSEIDAIVGNVSRQHGVLKVFVVDKQGEIRFSPVRQEIGTRIPLADPTCQICHAVRAESRSRTVVFSSAGGERVFRNVNPIANEAACSGCHSPADKLNGVLISDFSMAEVDRELASTFRGMVVALLLTVGATGLGITLIMNRLVIGKVERFVHATRLLARGRLDLEMAEGARDELGTLARSFNQMVDGLRRAKALRERTELLESVLDTVGDAVLVFGPEGTLLALNRASERALGVSAGDVVGSAASLLGDDQTALLARARAGGRFSEERRLRSRAGREFPARIHVVGLLGERRELLAWVAVVQDLTEQEGRERLQAQLAQSAKLAAIGRLAAGVAHELNNPLGNVLLHTKLLLEDLSPVDPRGATAERIVDNTLRCKTIVRGLLDYARPSDLEPVWTDVNEVVERSVHLVTPALKLHGVRCERRLHPGLPRVRCDGRQVEQVLVNLLQNGIEAMDGKGDRLTVFTTPAAAGGGVVVGVEDTGPGVAPDALDRLFEPFYTTKPGGTGLGLAISHGIVERHRGRIWAESRREGARRGATFFVELPGAVAGAGATPVETAT